MPAEPLDRYLALEEAARKAYEILSAMTEGRGWDPNDRIAATNALRAALGALDVTEEKPDGDVS